VWVGLRVNRVIRVVIGGWVQSGLDISEFEKHKLWLFEAQAGCAVCLAFWGTERVCCLFWVISVIVIVRFEVHSFFVWGLKHWVVCLLRLQRILAVCLSVRGTEWWGCLKYIWMFEAQNGAAVCLGFEVQSGDWGEIQESSWCLFGKLRTGETTCYVGSYLFVCLFIFFRFFLNICFYYYYYFEILIVL
jgi:hypothetical protein